jgi:hypothetical protein
VALLVVDLGERPQVARVDLAVLTAARGVGAVADVAPGAHHVSVQLSDGWYHGWAFVDADDDVVGFGPATASPREVASDAVVAMPPDEGGWALLTTHLDSRAALFDDADDAPVEPDATRFERVLAAHAGDGDRVLAALERAFLEWTLPPDGLDAGAGERWRTLVVAIAGAGPRGLAAAPALLGAAAVVLAAQLAALAPGSVDDSMRDALTDLADDLAEVPDLELAAATLRAGLEGPAV